MKQLAMCALVLGLTLSGLNAQTITAERSPANQTVGIDPSVPIVVQFSESISSDRISKAISVHGELSGPLDSDFKLNKDQKSLSIDLSDAPMAGEKVKVEITRDLFPEGFAGMSWEFFTKTERSFLEFNKSFEIPLRLPGEAPLQPSQAYGGDLNQDHYSDISIPTSNPEDLRVLLNDGTGHYQRMEVFPLELGAELSTKGADFNKDGALDLALLPKGKNLGLLLGGNSSTFLTGNSVDASSSSGSFSIFDFDLDGDEDVALANTDRITLLTNDGTGNFSKSAFDPRGIGESSICSGHANQDGIPDLFVGFSQSNQMGILLGNGKGGFHPSGLVKLPASPSLIKAADFNGDGNTDVILASKTNNLFMVSLGDGTGGYSEPTAYALQQAQSPSGIAIGDLDGDLDLDLVTSYSGSGTFVIWENNALGVFSKVQSFSIDGEATTVLLHDKDR
ncbi:MAG: hypothetical protein HKN16_10810, partial [Saprospiraceae bacterium]|nr:hypothetical protein [Saprospiraceae bacterium]